MQYNNADIVRFMRSKRHELGQFRLSLKIWWVMIDITPMSFIYYFSFSCTLLLSMRSLYLVRRVTTRQSIWNSKSTTTLGFQSSFWLQQQLKRRQQSRWVVCSSSAVSSLSLGPVSFEITEPTNLLAEVVVPGQVKFLLSTVDKPMNTATDRRKLCID